MITIRPVRSSDAAAIAALRLANREYLTPWEPARSDEQFTEEGVAGTLATAIADAQAGTGRSHVILDGERIVGQMMLNSVIRGAFQSCSLGYWVAESEAGRGVATEAVRLAKAVAFGELGLHRVQGETLAHNLGSQKVLERNGFVRYGLAPQYLKIADRWQDHVLYQALNPDMA
ncbi:[SSU ribosomal protein S5P]-alanine acetyltransferase [Glycomyces sambucus]|uniref:[SSU ribosomal protein S5P]-alanine acetyltransferase n=1 Tax=Glycomyces sambucus TaxID=380244 RepID=A0A1G9CPA0_9ACTN|nr:GNAT family protein [Glycomyces sambucus]SDK53429.1 [SSU ribosomal protein S5P]-alanine acetyltransferase [Glycomyces sambucus]